MPAQVYLKCVSTRMSKIASVFLTFHLGTLRLLTAPQIPSSDRTISRARDHLLVPRMLTGQYGRMGINVMNGTHPVVICLCPDGFGDRLRKLDLTQSSSCVIQVPHPQ